MIFYFRYEKARMERKRVAEASKGVGRPKVGGKFELRDHEGKVFTDQDMKGRFTLVCWHSVLLARERKELSRKGLEGGSDRGTVVDKVVVPDVLIWI